MPIKLPPGAELVSEDSPSLKLPPGAELVSDGPDFSNEKNEGLYEMKGKDGTVHQVPYSKVQDAFKAGIHFSDPDAFHRYTKDQEAEGPGAVSRFASSFGGSIADAAKGLYRGVVEGPQNPREARDEQLGGKPALVADRMIVQPAQEQAGKTVESAKKVLKTPITSPESADAIAETGAHALATVLPGVGPWAAQVGEKVGQQVGSGDVAGAAGTLSGNALMYEAPHAIGKIAAKIPNPLRAGVEAVTETSPREINKVAEETVEGNTKALANAAEKDKANLEGHFDKAYDAAHETRGNEIQHDINLKTAKAEADEKNAELAREYSKKVQEAAHDTAGKEIAHKRLEKAENDAARSKHELDVAKVQQHNHRTAAKHAAEVQKLTEENKAAEHKLEMRRAEEQGLEQDTKEYYAKEDEVKAKAKNIENSKWAPWREKMKGVTVDGAEIEAQLKPILEVSPEARRVLRQLTPDPGDAAPDSLYAQDRAAIMKSQGIHGSYWELPPERRAIVDQIAASNGFEPDPIDFNPQAGAGIPIEQIHRAKSIIGRDVYAGRYEGVLEGEMKKLGKALEQAETRASLKAGALDDLKAARQATTEYQKAFGKERPSPRTVDNARMKGVNPEQFKADADLERLEAAKVHDPSLVDAYKKVKERRERLRSLETEEELRKRINQIPKPPTVDDLREGYNLKVEPTPPKPINLEPPPRVPPPEPPKMVEPKVPVPPDRNIGPDRPNPVDPGTKTITAKDYSEHKGANVQKLADQLRYMGVRRALYATMGSPIAIAAFFSGDIGKALEAGAVAGPMVFAGSHALANLLEKPEVKNWLSKVTPKDVARLQKLPPEQRAVFAEDMKVLAEAAKKKGLPVSPAIQTIIGASAAQKPSLDELKKEAEKRRPAPGPQSSNKPAHTHIYDEEKDAIVPV